MSLRAGIYITTRHDMNEYSFTVRLNRIVTDAEFDAIIDAGLDASVSDEGSVSLVMVSQEAATIDDAIMTVIGCLRELGLVPVGIANDDLVRVSDIARHTSRTHESVRLLAAGKRGPGGFPAPVSGDLYSWEEVRRWFADYEGETAAYDAEDATLAAADLFLRAKVLRPEPGRLIQLAA